MLRHLQGAQACLKVSPGMQVLKQGLGEAMQKLERSLPPSRSPSPVRERPAPELPIEAC